MATKIKVKPKTTVHNVVPSKSDETYQSRVLIGSPGMGKSSLEDQYIQAAYKERRDVMIIDPNNVFPGYAGVWWEGIAEVENFVWSLKGNRRGLLLMDDADIYLDSTASKLSVWRDLFSSFRHWGLDIVVSTRRPQEVPKLIMSNSSYLAIFNCRGHRERGWLTKERGSAIMRQIPREPHQYLLVNCDTDEAVLHSTVKRTTVTAADTKV